jgi:hypothetical protein
VPQRRDVGGEAADGGPLGGGEPARLLARDLSNVN